MLDAAVEYASGKECVEDFIARDLFDKGIGEVEQRQKLTAQAMNAVMMQGGVRKENLLKRSAKDLSKMGIDVKEVHSKTYQGFVQAMAPDEVNNLLVQARSFRYDHLAYDSPTDKQKARVDRWAKQILACIAMVVLVVVCFITEAMQLPGAALCIGLILVFSGIVPRTKTARHYWSVEGSDPPARRTPIDQHPRRQGWSSGRSPARPGYNHRHGLPRGCGVVRTQPSEIEGSSWRTSKEPDAREMSARYCRSGSRLLVYRVSRRSV
jgi:hypothetical protein